MDTLLSAATATGAGAAFTIPHFTGGRGVVQAILSATTTPSATVDIEVSVDGINWVVHHTFTLTTSGETQGYFINEPWLFMRANVTAISGTSADVSVISHWREQ